MRRVHGQQLTGRERRWQRYRLRKYKESKLFSDSEIVQGQLFAIRFSNKGIKKMIRYRKAQVRRYQKLGYSFKDAVILAIEETSAELSKEGLDPYRVLDLFGT